MREPAETRAHLKTAISALREAWPCDHTTHVTDPQAADLARCPGYAVQMAIQFAQFGLKRLAREQEVARRG